MAVRTSPTERPEEVRHAEATVWRRSGTSGPLVALTFDDCDAEEPWMAILDTLAAHGARASFFPNGIRVEELPDAARRTAAEGHEAGTHGYDHARLSGLAFEEVAGRLEADRAAWLAVTGDQLAPWFRPPYGDYDDVVLSAAAACGFRDVVMWDVDPRDWKGPPAEVIVRRVVGQVRPGSIVALHVTERTAAALPRILDELRTPGLQTVRLSDLALTNRR